MKIPEITRREEVYNNNWRKIIVKTLKTKTGILQAYPINSHCGPEQATMVFPISKDNKVIYCKEWRPGIEDFVHCFPVGMQEADLDFRENAIKELKEEVGCTSDEVYSLGESIISNFDTTIAKYFVALNCEVGENNLEDGENIEVLSCSLDEFEEKINSGEINCPLTISCYTKAKIQNKI
ncbi:NUDIX hydrolase [Candidatus Gracilibacteria bacterium]|nr:NUDIX hydrolase [Candidatus Gracilibacteria bacterium]